MNITPKFQKYLKKLKGSRLAVMTAIILNADESGNCKVTYETLIEETGLTRGTIASALECLCSMVIDNQPMLERHRERNEANQFTGPNIYQLFPMKGET